MKYIKQFEELKDGVEIGDYILFGSKNPNWDVPKTEYHKYLQTHIGKLFDYVPEYNAIYIEFDELPENPYIAASFFRGKTGKRLNDYVNIGSNLELNPDKYYALAPNKILYHSKNKEDIEMMMNSEKYNL